MKKILIFIIVVVALVTAWQYRGDLQTLVRSSQQLAELVHEGTLLDTLRKEVFAPPPLRFDGIFSESALTRTGVISATNEQRRLNGAGGLRENTKLNAAAAEKVNDMFEEQYFEHESPSGVGPADLAKNAGYDYIIIGENLALGNFKDDALLVEAWMNSPGHRENILNAKFTEIGVAVGKGTFKGEKVWFAVQEFGKPATACPQVSTQLKQQVDSLKTILDGEEQQLSQEKARLDAMHPKTKEEYDAYNQAVAEYNQKVRAYNDKLNQLKELVNQYNAQVRDFNSCVSA